VSIVDQVLTEEEKEPSFPIIEEEPMYNTREIMNGRNHQLKNELNRQMSSPIKVVNHKEELPAKKTIEVNVSHQITSKDLVALYKDLSPNQMTPKIASLIQAAT